MNDKWIKRGGYAQLQAKISKRFWGIAGLAVVILFAIYALVWRGNGGDVLVAFFEKVFDMDNEAAYWFYHSMFRRNKEIIFVLSVIFIFLLLLHFLFRWLIQYFDSIIDGIDRLAGDNPAEIQLPAELSTLANKLNQVKHTLKTREITAKSAEQKKNELVMYLAHDIRTPLTSVIGYLNLLEEAPNMPQEQKAKYLHITTQKAYQLEKMMNELFEITRYNQQQIDLAKENIDLYYMLVQLTDEMTPILSANENEVRLEADENLIVCGDANKLARVFNNVLKNAATYSEPRTEIVISAVQKEGNVVISFINQGKTIPKEKLQSMFEKFCRLDEARTSNGSGTGLGLAIAKEIVTLHGGTVTAMSENGTTQFDITLPVP